MSGIFPDNDHVIAVDEENTRPFAVTDDKLDEKNGLVISENDNPNFSGRFRRTEHNTRHEIIPEVKDVPEQTSAHPSGSISEQPSRVIDLSENDEDNGAAQAHIKGSLEYVLNRYNEVVNDTQMHGFLPASAKQWRGFTQSERGKESTRNQDDAVKDNGGGQIQKMHDQDISERPEEYAEEDEIQPAKPRPSRTTRQPSARGAARAVVHKQAMKRPQVHAGRSEREELTQSKMQGKRHTVGKMSLTSFKLPRHLITTNEAETETDEPAQENQIQMAAPRLSRTTRQPSASGGKQGITHEQVMKHTPIHTGRLDRSEKRTQIFPQGQTHPIGKKSPVLFKTPLQKAQTQEKAKDLEASEEDESQPAKDRPRRATGQPHSSDGAQGAMDRYAMEISPVHNNSPELIQQLNQRKPQDKRQAIGKKSPTLFETLRHLKPTDEVETETDVSSQVDQIQPAAPRPPRSALKPSTDGRARRAMHQRAMKRPQILPGRSERIEDPTQSTTQGKRHTVGKMSLTSFKLPRYLIPTDEAETETDESAEENQIQLTAPRASRTTGQPNSRAEIQGIRNEQAMKLTPIRSGLLDHNGKRTKRFPQGKKQPTGKSSPTLPKTPRRKLHMQVKAKGPEHSEEEDEIQPAKEREMSEVIIDSEKKDEIQPAKHRPSRTTGKPSTSGRAQGVTDEDAMEISPVRTSSPERIEKRTESLPQGKGQRIVKNVRFQIPSPESSGQDSDTVREEEAAQNAAASVDSELEALIAGWSLGDTYKMQRSASQRELLQRNIRYLKEMRFIEAELEQKVDTRKKVRGTSYERLAKAIRMMDVYSTRVLEAVNYFTEEEVVLSERLAAFSE